MIPVKKWFLNNCPNALLVPAVKICNKAKTLHFIVYAICFPQNAKKSCPCCGLRFRKFISGDFSEQYKRFNPKRYETVNQEVICPFCKSFPRHRIMALWCETHMLFFKNAKILFFAPERSEVTWLRRKKITCTTADLLRNDLDLQIDIQSTNLPDASYDVVIANHVLEHVDDFRKALKEMHRILRPNGFFICSFPMDPKIELLDEETEPLPPEERLRRFGQNDHKRVFGMKADKFLTEAGFDVETIRGEDYSDEILPVVGPADYDMNILFCCRKPE